ncbi:MAG: VWA domain-containing protein [Marinomonas sp.]
MSTSLIGLGGALAALSFSAAPASAQSTQQADEEDYDAVIVTGMRIRQGGAQDANHFRSISLDGDSIELPRASSFTVEGLMGEHDLTLPANKACEQLFCINAQSMRASLPAEPDSTVFVGLGFESGAKPENYTSIPISIVAVVDRSGSMSGAPITRAKEGLQAALGMMRPGDRMGIVVYGSKTNVHLPVTDVEGNRDAISEAIDTIAINGATYMEAGMKLGYATAMEELEHSNGKTRMLLFSDENANVGNTDADGFMGQANRGAAAGIGLTSIGVGRIFDGALATKISSVPGGNLFFVDKEGDAAKLFEKEFFNMSSEVARNIEITIAPAKGFKVAEVYGVPADIITRASDGSVTATIGSAFMSSKGGGIFATLSGNGSGASTANVAISYEDLKTGERENDTARVAALDANPAAPLVKAHLLVDQYTAITGALNASHRKDDPLAAQASLADLEDRVRASGIAGMERELELIAGLRGKAGKLAALASNPAIYRARKAVGEWRVLAHRGVDDVARGDLITITDDGEFITENGGNGPNSGDEIYQEYEINGRQIQIKEGRLVMDYTINGDRMRMRNPVEGTMLLLERDDT